MTPGSVLLVIQHAVVCAVLRMVYVDQPFWPTDVFVAMAATPLAMQVCGMPFDDAAFVLEWHVIGMFC